ncbi:isoaspartyl peptidase/L-asparaginase family protein [Aquimarina brevivitae]|uniref:Isoaspartyl peptidase n=1 Tax=Aquimarina brevivitae TaxID=323412 RepID=A0A4Q7PH33_9FLAO|nr:isoaspartyl peptidase/L-asparaginase [Aquimarina brevivitae]RZS99090.1 beta-aspartyl-peptidase (threonine type) [Aquimarina brevivitae]
MRSLFLIITLTLFSYSCKQESDKISQQQETAAVENTRSSEPTFGLVIHGGAGTILKENMTPEKEQAYKAKLKEAITTGHTILKNGGTSLEAVQKTINILEDSPLFNAGKGAVFTSEGTNELDASIMDGKTLNAGAVAGVTTVKNPINLANEVMINSPHVLLAGKGAEQFAAQRGVEQVQPEYFFTQDRFDALQRIKEKEAIDTTQMPVSFYDPIIKNSKYGTVGCVALDQQGNLAAGTSTGGMTNKKWNRIGDAPLIGAGTYANNATCAVSSTGWGEYFIRGLVAYDVAAMMEYKGIPLKGATTEVIQKKLTELGGTGGVIAIDHQGNVAMEFNTPGMYRASMNAAGELNIGIYKEQE